MLIELAAVTFKGQERRLRGFASKLVLSDDLRLLSFVETLRRDSVIENTIVFVLVIG